MALQFQLFQQLLARSPEHAEATRCTVIRCGG